MPETDIRPEWKHSIKEDAARWLWKGMINKITHHWRMTSADTSEDWIELHRDKEKRTFPSNFLDINGYWAFKPNGRELVTPTYKGEEAIKTIQAIDAWEAKNKRDRAEFERLKRKFDA